MKSSIDSFIGYIRTVRRFSSRTVELYTDILREYEDFSGGNYSPNAIRAYEVDLLDAKGENARTVVQHLSVLSSYCRYLVREGVLESNPVRLVSRPKLEKRLPQFFREESMKEYFDEHPGTLEFGPEDAALRYLTIDILYSTGLRRSELIGLKLGDVDFSRMVIRVHGKGDKVREIPMTESLAADLRTYLERFGRASAPDDTLLVTPSGRPLYPVWIDRAVKAELGSVAGITTRRSPHSLRHTLATELLENGTELNSIKELLGHSSLAATQVYTHNSVERLRAVYSSAHPRAKK